jgi:hypothetical protein
MPISWEYARSLCADLTQSATVPLDPDELLHMPGLRQHGHVFFGGIAVRCYKHKARWTYNERDIRAAGRAFAELDLDLDDVVGVQLPAYRDIPERDEPSYRNTPSSVPGHCHGRAFRLGPVHRRHACQLAMGGYTLLMRPTLLGPLMGIPLAWAEPRTRSWLRRRPGLRFSGYARTPSEAAHFSCPE